MLCKSQQIQAAEGIIAKLFEYCGASGIHAASACSAASLLTAKLTLHKQTSNTDLYEGSHNSRGRSLKCSCSKILHVQGLRACTARHHQSCIQITGQGLVECIDGIAMSLAATFRVRDASLFVCILAVTVPAPLATRHWVIASGWLTSSSSSMLWQRRLSCMDHSRALSSRTGHFGW